jgi:hypothetical protein
VKLEPEAESDFGAHLVSSVSKRGNEDQARRFRAEEGALSAMDRGRLGAEGFENILQSRTDMIHRGCGDRPRPMPGYSDGEHERHRGRMLPHPPCGFQMTIRRADG